MLFDGSSKGNLGIVGAGGVIFDSKGNKQKEYAWGIGRATNSGVEWLALIKGLELARDMGIEEMSAVGDSLIVTREARNISRNRKSPSSKMHHLLYCLAKEFKSINFLHVLRCQNDQADSMVNKGVVLHCGVLEKDNVTLENIWIP